METGQKEIATQAFSFVTFKISNWCQSTHHEILHMEINLNFKKKRDVLPRKAAKLKKVVWNWKKNDVWHRKVQDRHMVGPTSLYCDMSQSCETAIGVV